MVSQFTPLHQAMKTTLGIALGFLVLFCLMILVAINGDPKIPSAQALGLALEWTIHLVGGLVASISAVGMLLVAAGHGSFQRQIVLVLPLLAGLLLLTSNWGLALAVGAVACVWIFKYGAPDIERAGKTPSGS